MLRERKKKCNVKFTFNANKQLLAVLVKVFKDKSQTCIFLTCVFYCS